MVHNINNNNMTKYKSFYPPVCVQGPISGKYYIITDGKWNEVKRMYSWSELESMWEKITYSKPIKKEVSTKRDWKVTGSKGNKYTVSNDNGFWSCSCPAHAFGRGKDCKHIILIKSKSNETSKQTTKRKAVRG